MQNNFAQKFAIVQNHIVGMRNRQKVDIKDLSSQPIKTKLT